MKSKLSFSKRKEIAKRYRRFICKMVVDGVRQEKIVYLPLRTIGAYFDRALIRAPAPNFVNNILHDGWLSNLRKQTEEYGD